MGRQGCPSDLLELVPRAGAKVALTWVALVLLWVLVVKVFRIILRAAQLAVRLATNDTSSLDRFAARAAKGIGILLVCLAVVAICTLGAGFMARPVVARVRATGHHDSSPQADAGQATIAGLVDQP